VILREGAIILSIDAFFLNLNIQLI